MPNNKLLHHLKNKTYCRLGKSMVHGVGVFAIKKIPKGINPFTLSDQYCNEGSISKIKVEDLQKLPKAIQTMVQDFFSPLKKIRQYKKNEYLYLPTLGLNSINISYYLNHSNHQNMNIEFNKECFYTTFTTKRVIQKGEELTINYNEFRGKK